MSQAYERFWALHEAPGAFLMPNVWDGASALIMADAGFEALASSSVAFAATLGTDDYDLAVDRDLSVAHAGLLARVSGLPVNGDLAEGYGPSPEDCVATVEAAIAAGLAGLGIEDYTRDPQNPTFGFDEAVRRIEAAARAARGRIVLTGRTDIYLHGRPDLDEAIRRLGAFAQAGADVLYAPGLPDMESISAVVRAVAPKPVNVVVGPGATLTELQAAGVKRVSLGGSLHRKALGALADAARTLRRTGDIPAALAGAMPGSELARLIAR
jgi:2-methylisocitrate lyase-like PEP mutase family enzyme